MEKKIIENMRMFSIINNKENTVKENTIFLKQKFQTNNVV